jgi:putative transposase
MANTYTQIYLHVVFAVSGRACVIAARRREELQRYMTGIVRRKEQQLIAIYCMPDHTHLLLGLKPSIAPSDLIGDIKTGSNKSYQQAAMDRLSIFMAGRLWCVLGFSFTSGSSS